MFDRRLIGLVIALLVFCALFLGWGLAAPVAFILKLRVIKLLGLVIVGVAIGLSTVLFQTVTSNRILTPAIMGFDSLFLLMQTVVIFVLGGQAYLRLPDTLTFLAEVAIMVCAALALFAALLGKGRHDLHRMILTGIIFGLLFRSLTTFMQRIIDPSEFAIVQGAMFASFGAINKLDLAISVVLLAMSCVVVVRLGRRLDVMALGRGPAISLGLDYDRLRMQVLALIAVLVSVSTALVGPITFLGLLVASLAHSLMRSPQHALLLPAAGMIGALTLVGGQFLFERVLGLQSTLAVIIEFLGGLLFLLLVLKGSVR
jgi:iron complex transport system permease protein